jgi:hypothetical protein
MQHLGNKNSILRASDTVYREYRTLSINIISIDSITYEN